MAGQKPAFKQLKYPDQNVMLLQQNVADAIVPIQGGALVYGKVIAGVALKNGQITVQHNLGYQPSHYLWLDLLPAATASLVTVNRVSWNSSQAIFQANAAATGALWIR